MSYITRKVHLDLYPSLVWYYNKQSLVCVLPSTACQARHIQINLSSRGVNPLLFTEGHAWEMSARQLVGLAETYPETLFLVPVFQCLFRYLETLKNCVLILRYSHRTTSLFLKFLLYFSFFKSNSHQRREDLDSLPFFQKIMEASGEPLPNLLAFFDNSSGEGREPTGVPELPRWYPAGVPVGFTGGICSSNVKRWLTLYHLKASEAGCWAICDAQSGFRKGKKRGEPIDVEELQRLLQEAFEWGLDTS